jgi:hypothetical protein
MILDTLSLCMVFVWYRTDTIRHTHDVPPPESPPPPIWLASPSAIRCPDHGRDSGANFVLPSTLRQFRPSPLYLSLYVSIAYRLWILNLILFDSLKSHVYVLVTADTFFLLPSF